MEESGVNSGTFLEVVSIRLLDGMKIENERKKN